MNFMRLCHYPFAIFPVFTFLCHLPDIDLRIEIRSKRFTMITGITINNIKVMHFIKMMFGSIGCVN